MATYAHQMQAITNKYIESGQPWPATSRQIAAWAVKKGLWQPHRERVIAQCAEDLSRAMREEYVTDAQGRSVRAKHAARLRKGGEQMVLWADIRTAPRGHMEIAFAQRRKQIVGDCRQLKCDVDSYNQNRAHGSPIAMVFNFIDDLREIEAVA